MYTSIQNSNLVLMLNSGQGWLAQLLPSRVSTKADEIHVPFQARPKKNSGKDLSKETTNKW